MLTENVDGHSVRWAVLYNVAVLDMLPLSKENNERRVRKAIKFCPSASSSTCRIARRLPSFKRRETCKRICRRKARFDYLDAHCLL